MAKKKKSKLNRNTWVDYLIYALVTIFALLTIYPIWYVIIGSFSDGTAYSYGGVWIIPKQFSLQNYQVVFLDSRFYSAYLITILRAVVGTVTSVLFTALISYAMSSKILIGKKFFMIASLFTLYFGGGMIPYYLVIINLGLFDTFWVYIIPALYSVYNMLIISNFFKNVPTEFREAALMDGMDELGIFWRIYLPLSTPVIATVSLWVFVGHWNGFMSTMLYTNKQSLWTLQYYLLLLIKESNLDPSEINMPIGILNKISPTTVSFAAIIVSVIPILLLYPFVQKNFGNDLNAGGVKN